jgi:RNA-directed DNA polymerase
MGLEENAEPSLLAKVSSASFLRYDAWPALNKKNKYSHGLDQESVSQFSQNLSKNIEAVSSALRAGEFRFRPARGTTIPKRGGKGLRPLRIFNVRDRLVQKSILLRIEEFFPEIHNKVSFAFLREQSVAKAVDAVKLGAKLGYQYVVLSDIESFFENIDRKLLHEELIARLPDSTINNLIDDAINTDIGNRSELSSEEAALFPTTTQGVAQGSILSPFFSNVYLRDLDKFLIDEGLYGIRYADDLAVLTTTRAEAQTAHQRISTWLQRFRGLRIYPLAGKKASKILPLRGGFEFLGIRFEYRRKKWHLEPAPGKRKEILDEIDRWMDIRKTWPLLDRIVILSRKFDGWMGCYRDVCSTKAFAIEVDEHFSDSVHKLFHSKGLIDKGTTLTRSQKRFLSIQKSIRSPKRDVLLPKGILGVDKNQ